MEKASLADDLMSGVTAIADFTGWPARRIYEEAEKGRLPLFKLPGGRIWQGRKSTLLEYIARLEAAGQPKAHKAA